MYFSFTLNNLTNRIRKSKFATLEKLNLGVT